MHECGIGFGSPVATFVKHFEQTKKVAERLPSAREDILFMGVVPHRPFTRTIEQIRQEQAPPDLALAGRSKTKLLASFKCRLCYYHEILFVTYIIHRGRWDWVGHN